MLRIAMALIVSVVVVLPSWSQTKMDKPAPNSPKEPFAKSMSLRQAGTFLDQASVHWTQSRKCGSCHSNYLYLMARPMLNEKSAAHDEVREFFEQRAANWDKAGDKSSKPRWPAEVIMTGNLLAINDSLTTKKLHPLTRQALDRMWTLQQKDGSFRWLKCNWPPMEHDDYFGAVITALGVGMAPEKYAETPKAQEGIAKLKTYFAKNKAPDLHHRTWLAWASLHLDGLMTDAERKATIAELQAKQNMDGGWSLPGLGSWKRHDKSDNDATVSDGYATGLALYVMFETKVPKGDAKVRAGLDWLRNNQRESGRWFTRSPSNDVHHFITHAGTAFAVMALRAYGEDVK